jgi:hypothetical protein
LRPGLVLHGVGTASVVGKSYDDTLALIKSGGRPLVLAFAPGHESTDGSLVSVTFVEEGSLGLKF